jgi:hypothetical protein
MSIKRIVVLGGFVLAFVAGYVIRVRQWFDGERAGCHKGLRASHVTAAPGKFDALSAPRPHAQPPAKHGVSNITYLTPTEGPMMGNTPLHHPARQPRGCGQVLGGLSGRS